MGAVKKRGRRHPLRNCSLRVSFMIYMLVAAAIGILALLLGVTLLEEMERETLMPYYETYDMSSQMYISESGQAFYNAYPIMSDEDQARMTFLHAAETIYVFAAVVLTIVFAGLLFYRRKLKRPMKLLNEASLKISRNDLDFHVQYQSKNEMGKLCRSIEGMRTALEQNQRQMWRAVEDRKQLNAAFAHDLRTPLTVLRGYTEMIQTYAPQGKLSEQALSDTAHRMLDQITRLQTYTDSMSRLQKLEDVQIRRQSCPAALWIERFSEHSRIFCEQHNKQLVFEVRSRVPTIAMDSDVVGEVCDNLLSNAVRFAREKVWVQVMINDGSTLAVVVSDDGRGFSPEELKRATNPFYRGEQGDNHHFGLGLSISKTLCEAHGGSLHLDNWQGGGAHITAIFSVPLFQ